LVEGMKWFQNAYTRRFNARHKAWGRLFGDRYKAVPVEAPESGGMEVAEYSATLIDYIHLNPAQAGLEEASALGTYRWSSLASGIRKTPKARPHWLDLEFLLGLHDLSDTVRGRASYLKRLEASIGRAGDKGLEAETNGGLWYRGTERFRGYLLERVAAKKKQRDRGEAFSQDWGEKRAGEDRRCCLPSFRRNRGSPVVQADRQPFTLGRRLGDRCEHPTEPNVDR